MCRHRSAPSGSLRTQISQVQQKEMSDLWYVRRLPEGGTLVPKHVAVATYHDVFY
jgi:hypothetical protein